MPVHAENMHLSHSPNRRALLMICPLVTAQDWERPIRVSVFVLPAMRRKPLAIPDCPDRVCVFVLPPL